MSKSTSRERKALIVVLAVVACVLLIMAFCSRSVPASGVPDTPGGSPQPASTLHVADTVKPRSVVKEHGRRKKMKANLKPQSSPHAPDSPLLHPVDRKEK